MRISFFVDAADPFSCSSFSFLYLLIISAVTAGQQAIRTKVTFSFQGDIFLFQVYKLSFVTHRLLGKALHTK